MDIETSSNHPYIDLTDKTAMDSLDDEDVTPLPIEPEYFVIQKCPKLDNYQSKLDHSQQNLKDCQSKFQHSQPKLTNDQSKLEPDEKSPTHARITVAVEKVLEDAIPSTSNSEDDQSSLRVVETQQTEEETQMEQQRLKSKERMDRRAGLQGLNRLTNKIMKRYREKGTVKCLQCDTTISVCIANLVDHAQSHWSPNCFGCAFCDQNFVTKRAALLHAQQYHSIVNALGTMATNCFVDLRDLNGVFRQAKLCFDTPTAAGLLRRELRKTQ